MCCIIVLSHMMIFGMHYGYIFICYMLLCVVFYTKDHLMNTQIMAYIIIIIMNKSVV